MKERNGVILFLVCLGAVAFVSALPRIYFGYGAAGGTWLLTLVYALLTRRRL